MANAAGAECQRAELVGAGAVIFSWKSYIILSPSVWAKGAIRSFLKMSLSMSGE